MGAWASPVGIEYVVDRLNGVVLAMIAALGVATAVWMPRSIAAEIRPQAQTSYYCVFLLFATGLLGITITGDVFNLYVLLEIASITSYVLIGMGRRRQALYAGYSYLIVGSLGATFILLGIGHLYMATGTLSMADIAQTFREDPTLHASSVVRTSYAFFAIGLAIKMALFPLHGWQPGAYTHAPSAASIFIAATATKVSVYALYRITFGVFGTDLLADALPLARDVLTALAAGAMVIGPLLAIGQGNLKRLLAYSSVGQVGYLVLGLTLLNEEGLVGSLIHFWNHAAAKGALFCVAGVLAYRTGATRVEDLKGLGARAPWTASVLTVAGCSMVGVPLTAGFQTKWHLAAGALDAERGVLVAVLVLSSLLSAVYVWRLVQNAWFAAPEERRGDLAEAPWSMRAPALALGAACLVLGVLPFPVELARDAAEALLR
jgi:multicomponent Na+:H+ antiporter subunit D